MIPEQVLLMELPRRMQIKSGNKIGLTDFILQLCYMVEIKHRKAWKTAKTVPVLVPLYFAFSCLYPCITDNSRGDVFHTYRYIAYTCGTIQVFESMQ